MYVRKEEVEALSLLLQPLRNLPDACGHRHNGPPLALERRCDQPIGLLRRGLRHREGDLHDLVKVLPAGDVRVSQHVAKRLLDGRDDDARVDGEKSDDWGAGHGDDELHRLKHLDVPPLQAAVEVVDERDDDELPAGLLLERAGEELEELLQLELDIGEETQAVLDVPRLVEDLLTTALATLPVASPRERTRRRHREHSGN